MTTFKELEANIQLHSGAKSEISVLKSLTGVLYKENVEKYNAAIKLLTELEEDTKQSRDSNSIELKISKLFTKALYKKNPLRYTQNVIEFGSRIQKNHPKLYIDLICNWLVHSSYTDREALNSYRRYCKPYQICEATISSEQKYNLFTKVYTLNNWLLPRFIKELADTVSIELLEPADQLQLINNLIVPYLYEQNTIPATSQLCINKLIAKVSMLPGMKTEAVKILVIHHLLNKENLDKLAVLFPDGKLNTVLKTAQALGLDKNPDYWTQSLESQSVHPISTDLPEFD